MLFPLLLASLVSLSLPPQDPQPLLLETRGPVDCSARVRTISYYDQVAGVGDFDGDELVDLWRWDLGWNRGDGRFERGPTQVLTRDEPVSQGFVRVFDLEGDGDLDVLAGPSLELFENQGDGTFTSTLVESLGDNWDVYQALHGIHADFDGDGTQDLVYSYHVEENGPPPPGYSEQWSAVYLSQSGGGWNEIELPGAVGPAVAIDVEPDGDPDLLGYDRLNGSWYVYTKGSGASFTRQPNPPTGLLGYGVPEYPADYDGDGLQDFTLRYRGEVWLNDGASTFSLAPPLPSGIEVVIGTTDFDSDGAPDLLASRDDGQVVGLRNEGGAVFSTLFSVADPARADQAFHEDVDGDGDRDLILAGDSVAVFHQVAPLVFHEDLGTQTGRQPRGPSTTIADIDGDGDPDAYLGSAALYVNDGTGTLDRDATRTVGSSNGTRVFLDFDMDGDQDHFSGQGPGPSHLFENDGAGFFTPVPGAVLPALLDDPLQVLARDVSGDGRDDLLLWVDTLGTGELRIWENAGSGVFVERDHPISGSFRPVDVGDVDGNGTLDVLSGNSLWTRIGAWPATGTIPFQAAPVPPDFFAQVLADVDGDGDLDAVTGGVAFRNPGNGLFEPAAVPSTGSCDAVGDLDGDGDLDLLTLVSPPTRLVWEENDGSGNFTLGGGHSYDPTGTRPLSTCALLNTNSSSSSKPVLCDLDLDGDADLIWRTNLQKSVFSNVARGLYVAGIPGPGQELELSVHGPPNTLYVILFSTGTQEALLRWGRLFLDLAGRLPVVPTGVLGSAGRSDLAWAIPDDPALVGLTFVGQAAVGAPLRFTNADWFTFADQ